MRNRLLVSIILVPIGLLAIYAGGWIYASIIIAFLVLAAWEYTQLFKASGYQPAGFLIVGGVLLLGVSRQLHELSSAPLLLSLLILASMAYHLFAYERGRDLAPVDFGVTLGGLFYIGFIGAYMISLRSLPDGRWWVLTVLPAVWLADSGAYLVGSRFGRHKLAPRLSPKKSWEGYFGGIMLGTVFTALITAAWQIGAGPDSSITIGRGVIVGLVMSILPTLGDLGESMVKRLAQAKDSGSLLPGHGGAFDRIDSWLWAGVIGYYLVSLLWV